MNNKNFWLEMENKANMMFEDGASYYEVKCYIIDKAISKDIDADYNVREFYANVINVTIKAYRKKFNGLPLNL